MDKKRIQHMGLAAVLSIAMLGTTVPVTVLAATPTGTASESEEAQAPSSKEEAEAAKNEAQKRLDASEKAYKDAQAKKEVLHFFLGDFNKRTNLHRSATA